jgi:hypothetical protein
MVVPRMLNPANMEKCGKFWIRVDKFAGIE